MTLAVGGAGPLAVDDGGAGEPALLFVHSLGGRASFFDGALAHLRPRHRAVAYDQCGHGASAAPSGGEPPLSAWVADLLAVADALRLARFVLVGHSFGATVALAAAARAPARVRGLVLVDAGGSFAAAPAGALAEFLAGLRGEAAQEVARETFEANLDRAQPATRAAVLASLAATPPAVVAAGYATLLGADPATLLAAYPGPLLLVVDGANDSPFSLHAQQPALPRRVVEGTSHWIPLDRPAAFHAILDDFLAALPAA